MDTLCDATAIFPALGIDMKVFVSVATYFFNQETRRPAICQWIPPLVCTDSDVAGTFNWSIKKRYLAATDSSITSGQ
jgi:hypothetical protein